MGLCAGLSGLGGLVELIARVGFANGEWMSSMRDKAAVKRIRANASFQKVRDATYSKIALSQANKSEWQAEPKNNQPNTPEAVSLVARRAG